MINVMVDFKLKLKTKIIIPKILIIKFYLDKT